MKAGDLVKFYHDKNDFFTDEEALWWIGILVKYTLHLDKWDILHQEGLVRIEHRKIKKIGKKDESW